ncbi:MAG: CusA/CzcA family heavy metal efflux RND transporter [Gammaproteobacteria bacterium]|nr:CusA/CzcA family heavy metal efflux RND transporter [Gammaproteobacteria bacterium]MDH5261597.1 CusA/CzcA family heavy metal efflux RND transporter [Gammaproteobacteria bacterium]MDH5582684.1 CusA/CzcA family heavy metal efflux RND transporter [Gammaproteobacteria bacterium]
MIAGLIRWSIGNRVLVLTVTFMVTAWGLYAVSRTPVDALPDLSDVQVIIKTSFPGQAPQLVEDQVTYPLTTAMLSVPKAVNVRGYSFFGDSYVYVIFEDGTDLYWARSRVLEYLSQVADRLPANAKPALGPDATGVGWVFEYALRDRTGQHDLAQLRSLQDWFLKYELQTVHGVAEVATIGGMVRQYQVVVDPDKLRAFGIPLAKLKMAIQQGNQETGGSVIEMGEAEYMVRATGYLSGIEDLRDIPLGVNAEGTPVLLSDVAEIRIGPQMRRGIADLNGEGEVVGGVIIMRSGENALTTINDVKERLRELAAALPDGVEIVTTYDRSGLIDRAVTNLKSTLVKEFIAVALICAVFLFHMRSSAVIVLSLPVGILVAFIVMKLQGINANIMSLGGIAIAIGVMVDASIVMVENVHKHIEKEALTDENRWRIIADAATEVGRPIFFSLLIITLSFLPVFALEAQEGRLFAPLAYTKTYAMAAAAGISVTLVPVLMGYFIRGRITPEHRHPVSRSLIALYRPVIHAVVRYPRETLAIAGVIFLIGLWPATQLGSEFMPPLDEGDLMYMPTTYPGISIDKAREMLQHTDRMISKLPEVRSVFGKIGRAETATDPAPLTMIETVIQLKPREEWRAGMTPEKLRAELDRTVQYTGLTNAWVMPIKTRIDMLATGIKTPVGIKVAGPDLKVIERIGQDLERVIAGIDGTASVYSERVAGGRYVDVDIDRHRASRFGLNINDVQDVVRSAVGGMNVTQTIEGRERYPVNVRYPQSARDSVQKLRLLPIVTPSGARIALADVADVRVVDGPPAIKSENARLNGWTYVDIVDRDLGSYVAEAQRVVANTVKLPAGYSLAWSGQYEYMVRAKERLSIVGPVTLAIIILLLYISFRRFAEVAIIIGTLPMALIGGLWLLYLLDYDLSVAVGVGFIALAGLAVEIGVIMLVYLNQSIRQQRVRAEAEGRDYSRDDMRQAVTDGAVLRVRPILMTVASTTVGLLPIMLGSGTGSEVMQRIAAPMVGGLISATLLTLVVIPALYLLWRGGHFAKGD